MRDELSACIEIEADRVSRRVTIPRQVSFKLTPEIISRIDRNSLSGYKLNLDAEQLTTLRYYAFLNSCLLDKPDNLAYLRSSLTFNSCCAIANNPQSIVVRSIINSSGQISQEIQQDLWQNPDLLSKVIEVHYWLVEEILRQLPLSNRKHSFLFIWCWLLSAIALVLLLWLLPLSFLVRVTIAIVGMVLSKIITTYLIKAKLKHWILKQLSNGIFSKRNYQRKLAFSLLSLIA